MKWLILLNKTCWIFRKISLDLTPFRTAFGQFSLPLSNLERGKTFGQPKPPEGQG
jgi:hypothetical protein